jgi:hypothetical protein
LIRQYRAGIGPLDQERDRDLLARYARVIGKDLLRCLRREAILRGGRYAQNVGAIVEEVAARVPEHRPLGQELHALYRNPGLDKGVVERVLDEAEARLASNR